MNRINKYVIELNDICFSYSGSKRSSLNNINLKVKQGEVLVFWGQSGCGKSTLMRILNGLIPSLYNGELSGSGYINGNMIGKSDVNDISNSVCSVFQDPRSQFFTMKVFSEIVFGGEVRGINKIKMKEKLNKLEKIFSLGNILDRKIERLSSGEKQKVAIASSLMQDSKILLLDEPSANLDNKEREHLARVLLNLKKKGYTIILFEHRLAYLKNVVDRYINISNSHIIAEYGNYNEICKKQDKNIYRTNTKINSKIVLQAKGIADGYKKNDFLWKDVSFSAHEGEIIGIWGENGKGKTTLIKSLMGLKNPKRGQIVINGRNMSKRKRRKYSSYVMQDSDYQLFSATVSEQLLSFVEKSEINVRKMKDILKQLGLIEYINEYPLNLSGGQKQRISIGMAAMKDAPIWYMDEPTSGLDQESKEKVYNFIMKYAKKGRCIFIITHDLDVLENICSSVIVIEDKKMYKLFNTY